MQIITQVSQLLLSTGDEANASTQAARSSPPVCLVLCVPKGLLEIVAALPNLKLFIVETWENLGSDRTFIYEIIA